MKKMDTSKYMDKQITELSQFQSLNFMGDDDKQEVQDGDHGFEFDTVRSLSQSHNKDLDGTSLTGWSSMGRIDSAKFSAEKVGASSNAALISEIDRKMKEHVDILLHSVECLSARVSQLESKTHQIEDVVDDIKELLELNQGKTDGKLREMKNILVEVQGGVQDLRDKQEIAEAQLQLAKLQMSKNNQQVEKQNVTGQAYEAPSSVSQQSHQLLPVPGASPQLLSPASSVTEIVSERALREIYLKPFEFSVKEANPGAIMTAYNQINGHHADSHPFLLKQVLRGEWGWDGLVMSDWGGVNSTAASINAGLDLEMPGPTRWRKVEAVLAAVKAGEITEETIDARAGAVLRFLEREKCFSDPAIPPEQAVDRPDHRALIREAGAKGMVLLKNDGVLPLTKDKVRGKKIALFGYAKEALAHGGGSASVNAHYKVTPWDALHSAFDGDNVSFTYSKGAHTFRQLPCLGEGVVNLDGKPGFTFTITEPGTDKVSQTIEGLLETDVGLLNYAIEYKDIHLVGTYTPKETATYYSTLSGLGPTRLLIDGKVVSEQKDNCSDSMGFLFGGVPVPRVDIPLEAGRQYRVEIISQPPAPIEGVDLGILEGKVGVRLGWMSATEHDADILSEAVEDAKAADYAVVFTGHDPSWETEGQDQAGFHLPKDGSQDRLVAAVAAANPNTIVVNSTGVAVALPWLADVKALVQAWFPGQEAGNAIADVLTGAVNPEGHLTCTFPKALEDCPAHGNFPGTYEGRQLTVRYEEGVFIGYRHFDRLSADKVNFPFGFGLSYTTFDFSGLSVKESAPGEFVASVKVSNTGSTRGATAVQLYVGAAETKAENPVKSLAAFKKVTLDAGASTTVELPVRARDFAFWSEKDSKWFVDAGSYKFSIGKSAGELVATEAVTVAAQTWAP